MRRNLPIILLILASIVIGGCGRGNPLSRCAVGGHVTLDGSPLDRGRIRFSPQSPGGVSTGAVISNGIYSIPVDQGLPPGRYLVRINSTAPRPAEKTSPEEDRTPSPLGPPGIDRIAPAYNAKSQIVVEVNGDAKSSEFDFVTKSK